MRPYFISAFPYKTSSGAYNLLYRPWLRFDLHCAELGQHFGVGLEPRHFWPDWREHCVGLGRGAFVRRSADAPCRGAVDLEPGWDSRGRARH
jgi:hypothetical protein